MLCKKKKYYITTVEPFNGERRIGTYWVGNNLSKQKDDSVEPNLQNAHRVVQKKSSRNSL